MRIDDFKQNVKDKVAERAGYLCSNPSCNRMTIGPDNVNQGKSAKSGVASHICAASTGGARYDISQSSSERQSIANAIWLCGTCSMLIDKNNGLDYPSDHLKKWKKDHETLIKECLEGNKRIMFQFQKLSDQSNICRQIIKFLEQRGALFMEYKYEIPYHVFDSVKETRIFLTQIQVQITPGSPLEIMVDSINNACRHFMNTTNSSMSMTEMSYSLGAMRKIIGVNLLDMSKVYGTNVSGQLKTILPT